MLGRQKEFRYLVIAGMLMLQLPSFVTGNEVGLKSRTGKVAVTSSVYTWAQSITGDWRDPSSWEPARITPAPGDVLIFSDSGFTTARNVPTQTIGQLLVEGNTTVNLQSEITATLTIAGGVGSDLHVGSSSTMNLTGTNAITIGLAMGTTGIIEGSMTFASSAHRLTAAGHGAVAFQAGASFTADTGFIGNPFGTTNFNSVIFEDGSVYYCAAGGDPFGAPEPTSVAVFRRGSVFSLRGNAGTSFFSGRTYANFELNYPGGDVTAFGNHALVMDDLTVTAGRFHILVNGTPGHSIKGNITTAAATLLDFQASFPGQTINFNGNGPQTITILGGIGVNPGNTIAIDNPAGVTIETLYLAWNLELINGVVHVINPDPRGRLAVIGTVTRVNGYVDGRLLRDIDSLGTYTFDVGTKNGYSPVTVDVTAGNFVDGAGIQVRAVQSAHPAIRDPSKALSRYWEILPYNITESNLTFDYLDPADIPVTANESNFVIQKFNGGFTQPVGVIDTSGNTFRVDGVTDATGDWTLAEPSALLPPRTSFDYDGDGRADVSVFRPGGGAWYVLESTNGFTGVSFGNSTDKITPADFDGDGKTDIGVYRPSQGTWYWLNSSNGTLSAVPFGTSEDLPTPADYDGDGRADVSVFRPSNGVWYRLNSHDGSFYAVQFGASEDKPTIGDYDGDGRADVAVFRPSNGAWYRLNSSDGQFIGISFGLSTDLITPADFDGDGKTDVAVYRASTGTWYSLDSSNGALRAVPFGTSEDVPTAADFDGDGRADVSVFRPSNGVWYRLNSGNGSFFAVQFGISTDKPTPAAFRY